MISGRDIRLIVLFVQYKPQTGGFPLEKNRASPISPCATSQIGNSLFKTSK